MEVTVVPLNVMVVVNGTQPGPTEVLNDPVGTSDSCVDSFVSVDELESL